MSKVLKTDVHVTDDKLNVTILKAGDAVPKKLEKYVTNPKAFVDSNSADAATEATGDEQADLVAELKKRELPTSGTVEELRARIAEHDAELAAQSKE